MTNAVVQAARERRLDHEEMHFQVEYIVAHGIVSEVNGRRVIIGSAHFVFEDEHCWRHAVRRGLYLRSPAARGRSRDSAASRLTLFLPPVE